MEVQQVLKENEQMKFITNSAKNCMITVLCKKNSEKVPPLTSETLKVVIENGNATK